MADVARSETTDRQRRWVEMWREAVRASSIVSALVELSTSRFLELSVEAAELLGTTPRDGAGQNYLSFAQRPREAAQTIRLARDGVVDGIRARRCFRRPDGSSIEVESWAWAIRSASGPDLGLWVAASPAWSEDESNRMAEDFALSPGAHDHPELDNVRLTINHHWRIVDINDGGTALPGSPIAELDGLSVLELTHPADVLNLLLGFARATTETDTSFVVRWRHLDGYWRKTHLAPVVLGGEGTVFFEVIISTEPEPAEPNPATGASELAGHLRRIADTIEAAGMLAPLMQKTTGLGVSPASDLSPRQWEVVARLLRGERVATIAAEMYVSQSTVRNHLTAVYGKFGVHSQAELVAKLLHQEEETKD